MAYYFLTFIRISTFAFFVTGTSCLLAQPDVTYVPMNSFGMSTDSLVAEIRKGLREFDDNWPGSARKNLASIYEKKTNELTAMANADYFINDKELNSWIWRIRNEIISENPGISFPERILISRSPRPNAECWGEGTVIIHLGLLSRIETDDQLAFILAHEMAHQILNHTDRHIISNLEKTDARNLKKMVKSAGKVNTIKALVYDNSRHSRQYETQADSLAIVMLQKTTFKWDTFHSVFQVLDSADYPENRNVPNLRAYFDDPAYPFKDSWLKAPGHSFGGSSVKNDLFISDSLKSHPNIDSRIAYLQSEFGALESSLGTQLKPAFMQRIDLELANSAFILMDYAHAMFYTLQILDRYPSNRFYKSLLARIWFKLYLARKNHEFNRYVLLDSDYPKMKEELFVFLNNLHLTEIKHITYSYLKNEDVFDASNEQHLYMLWQVSNDLGKSNTCNDVEKIYAQNFPDKEFSESSFFTK